MSRFTAALCFLTLGACSNSGSSATLASLERSGKLALFCAEVQEADTSSNQAFDVVLEGFLPLAACAIEPENEGDVGVEDEAHLLGATTQTETGEVAAVDFTRAVILNTNQTVPGATYFAVGEQPTGLQISRFDPTFAYVSSSTSRTVEAVPTDELLLLTAQTVDSPLVPVEQGFADGPADLALYEQVSCLGLAGCSGAEKLEDIAIDARWLYVALPELGQIAQVQVTGEVGQQQKLEAASFFTLPTQTCETLTMVPAEPSTLENSYVRVCPTKRVVKTVQTTLRCTDGPLDGPRPASLTVDYGQPDDDDDDYLLVADANQPVIHRFKLGLGGIEAELAPIPSGTPTLQTSVTPLVPEKYEDYEQPNQAVEAIKRYLYAIDKVDGSILAISYDSPDSPEFGAVLPVLSGVTSRANEESVESRDRIRFSPSEVLAIEVITPFYDLEPSDAGPNEFLTSLCDPNDEEEADEVSRDPGRLKGVFLAVSKSNGTLEFVDVYDQNATCRVCGDPDRTPADETIGGDLTSIRRHRFRVGNLPSSDIGLSGTPQLQFSTSPGTLDDDGQPLSSDGPGLCPLGCALDEDADGPCACADESDSQCPTSMVELWPTDENDPSEVSDNTLPTLICANTQAWAQRNQVWEAVWNGAIPNTQGGLGVFTKESRAGVRGNWMLADDSQFCRAGVLGEISELPTGDPDVPLVSYAGDQLVITSDLPAKKEDRPECSDFLDNADDFEDRPIAFRIVSAFSDQLELGEPTNPDLDYDFDKVLFCFDQLVEYEVWTYDAYSVTGGATGFVNRGIPDSLDKRCILDPNRAPETFPDSTDLDPDTLFNGRAFPDTQFTNPFVSFKIEDFPERETAPGGETVDPGTPPPAGTTVRLSFRIENPSDPEVQDTNTTAPFSSPSSLLFSPEVDQLFFVDSFVGVERWSLDPVTRRDTFQ